MYADYVDNWLKSQEKEKPDPENTFLMKWMKVVIHCGTLGGTYILERKLRKSYYHPFIYSRHGYFNVSSDEAQKVVNTVLENEATTLRDGEEICFVISSGEGLSRPNGMVFTSERVMWYLSSKVIAHKQGTIAIGELDTPKVKKGLSDTCSVSFGDVKCGSVSDFRSDQLLLAFLRQIKLAANP